MAQATLEELGIDPDEFVEVNGGDPTPADLGIDPAEFVEVPSGSRSALDEAIRVVEQGGEHLATQRFLEIKNERRRRRDMDAFQALNAREGVELDVTTGISSDSFLESIAFADEAPTRTKSGGQGISKGAIRAGVGLAPTGADAMTFLERAGVPARFAKRLDGSDDTDKIIVETFDPETGTPRDVLVDPGGFNSMAELRADIQDIAPELLASAAALGSTVALGPGAGLAAQSGVGAGVSSIALGAQDAGIRALINDSPIRVGEIALRRGAEGVFDFGAGFGGAALVRQFNRSATRSFLRGIGQDVPAEDPRIVAVGFNRLNDILAAHGRPERMTLTLGQVTQVQGIQSAEAFATAIPGVNVPLLRAAQKRKQALRALASITKRGEPEPLAAETGAALAEFIQERSHSGLRSAIGEADALTETIHHRAVDILASGSRAGRSLSDVGLADALRMDQRAARLRFQAEAGRLYPDITEQADIAEAKRLLEEMTDIDGRAAGLSKTTTETVEPPLEELAVGDLVEQEVKVTRPMAPALRGSSKVLRLLQADDAQSVQQVRNFRNDLYNLVDEMPIDDVSNSVIQQVARELSASIHDAAERTGGDVAEQLIKANDHYREGIREFFNPEIADLQFTTAAGGYLRQPSRLATRFTGSPDAYRALRAILGKDSDAMRSVRRSMIDNIQRGAELPDGSIDPGKLVAGISGLKRKFKDELFGEVFGGQGERAARVAEIGRRVKRNVKSFDPVDVEEVERLFAGAGDIEDAAKGFFRRAKTRTSAERSELVQSALRGGKEADVLADDLVHKASLDEVGDIMGALRSGTDEQKALAKHIRHRTLVGIWDDILDSDGGGVEQTKIIENGGSIVDLFRSKSLNRTFGDITQQRKLRNILDDETWDTLTGVLRTESGVGSASRKSAVSSGASGGGLASGHIKSGIFLGNIGDKLKALPGFVQGAGVAMIMSSQRVIRALTTASSEAERSFIVRGIVSSPAFWHEALASGREKFRDAENEESFQVSMEIAEQVAEMIRDSIGGPTRAELNAVNEAAAAQALR